MTFKPSPNRVAALEPPNASDSPGHAAARDLVRRAHKDMLANEGWNPSSQRANAVRLICRTADLNRRSLSLPRGWVREAMLILAKAGMPSTGASVRWYRSAIQSGLIDIRAYAVPDEIVDWIEGIVWS